MSHIIKVGQVVVKAENLDLFKDAVSKVGGEYKGLVKRAIYSSEVTGHHFKLPEWRYTICVKPKSGALEYDNYGGAWGEQKTLDKVLQTYVEAASIREAEKMGFSLSEAKTDNNGTRVIKMYRM